MGKQWKQCQTLFFSKIIADGDCSHEIKRHLLLERKVMTNLDNIFKSRDITVPTKVRLSRLWIFQWSCMDVRAGLWRRLSTEELMLLNCGIGEESWESPGKQGVQTRYPKGNQPWIFTGRTDAEAPILWPPDAKSQLTVKDPNAGKDGQEEEKGVTEDEMVGWYHWLSGHEFEQTQGDSEGQGSMLCYSSWGCKESDTI